MRSLSSWPQLKQLRLSGILNSLEARNRRALEGKLAYTGFIAMCIGDEVARRENKKFALPLRRAQLRTTKPLQQFDFGRLPKFNRRLVHEVASRPLPAGKSARAHRRPKQHRQEPPSEGPGPLRGPPRLRRRLHYLRWPHAQPERCARHRQLRAQAGEAPCFGELVVLAGRRLGSSRPLADAVEGRRVRADQAGALARRACRWCRRASSLGR